MEEGGEGPDSIGLEVGDEVAGAVVDLGIILTSSEEVSVVRFCAAVAGVGVITVRVPVTEDGIVNGMGDDR